MRLLAFFLVFQAQSSINHIFSPSSSDAINFYILGCLNAVLIIILSACAVTRVDKVIYRPLENTLRWKDVKIGMFSVMTLEIQGATMKDILC